MSNELEWVGSHPSVGSLEIAEIEEALGVRLPADYAEVAQQHHGGRPTKNSFTYTDPDIGSVEGVFAELLSLDPEYPDNILETKKDLQFMLPKDVLPVVFDGGGDYVCLDFRGTAPEVVYWSHESEAGNSLFPLASSFSEFMESLH